MERELPSIKNYECGGGCCVVRAMQRWRWHGERMSIRCMMAAMRGKTMYNMGIKLLAVPEEVI
jgi:hypothetical protein